MPNCNDGEVEVIHDSKESSIQEVRIDHENTNAETNAVNSESDIDKSATGTYSCIERQEQHGNTVAKMNVDAFIDVVRRGMEKKKVIQERDKYESAKTETNKENILSGSNQARPIIKKPIKISPVKTPERMTKNIKMTKLVKNADEINLEKSANNRKALENDVLNSPEILNNIR